MLRANLGELPFTDFQDWRAWRRLVPPTAAAIIDQTGSNLIMAQTVTQAAYWAEITDGLAAADIEVVHVFLDCDPSILKRRIAADKIEAGASDWRTSHVDAFSAARAWLVGDATLTVDTSNLDASSVADQILAAVA